MSIKRCIEQTQLAQTVLYYIEVGENYENVEQVNIYIFNLNQQHDITQQKHSQLMTRFVLITHQANAKESTKSASQIECFCWVILC